MSGGSFHNSSNCVSFFFQPTEAIEACPTKKQAESALPGQLGAKKQPTMTSFLTKPYAHTSARAKTLNRGLAEFVVTDMRPLNLIEGNGFVEFCKLMDPRYKVISRNTCQERFIVPMYHLSVAEVKSELAKSPAHSFTTDAWTNKSMASFITTTAHCIDPNSFELKSFVLDTSHVTERHTAQMLCGQMEQTETKWGLKHVTGVSDNAANIRNAFVKHEIPFLGCFAHTINLAVSKGLDENSVKRLTGKVRSLVSTFKHSYLKTQDLHDNQKLLDIQELNLMQDVTTRWNSVYYMIDRLLAVYPAVYGSLYGTSDQHLLLTDEERKNLEEISQLLEPFERATRQVSAEKKPTAGLILPYLQNFLTMKLADSPNDLNIVKKIKQSMKSDLSKRYTDEKQWLLLATVSALDPRVRTLDWLSHDKKEQLFEHLKDLCVAQSDKDDEPNGKRLRIENETSDLTNEDFDGLIKISEPSIDVDIDYSIEQEIGLYRQEPSLGMGFKEPLQWWRTNQYRYPHLTRVMLQMLHIPASSVSSERVFSTAGNIYKNREHLTPENANMMVFLYHNYSKTKNAVHLKWDDATGDLAE